MMTFQKPTFLDQDEEVILYSQGGYKGYLGAGWKLGHHYLTNKRLAFSQPASIFEIPLNSITAITIEKQKFVLRTKKVMCISYTHPRTQRSSKILVIMNNLEAWRKRIFELSLFRIDQESVDRISRELDEESQSILWYLWENRHARIDELADLISAPSHMDVLFKIREIINPAAEKLIGSPILSFEKSKTDYETGEKVLFSWWIAGKEQKPIKREPLIDIFDEGNYLTVITELSNVTEGDKISVSIEQKTLFVSNGGGELKIDLPCQVDPKKWVKAFKNGVLQVRLKKPGLAGSEG